VVWVPGSARKMPHGALSQHLYGRNWYDLSPRHSPPPKIGHCHHCPNEVLLRAGPAEFVQFFFLMRARFFSSQTFGWSPESLARKMRLRKKICKNSAGPGSRRSAPNAFFGESATMPKKPFGGYPAWIAGDPQIHQLCERNEGEIDVCTYTTNREILGWACQMCCNHHCLNGREFLWWWIQFHNDVDHVFTCLTIDPTNRLLICDPILLFILSLYNHTHANILNGIIHCYCWTICLQALFMRHMLAN